ncbi:MAG: glycoside hydrolase family 9 protein [Oscillospiraceae bacterium]|jgi:endoglucanase|nr:glycoside hydrolase family 9 protein [Oscillospiraceae bacterium]
MKKLVPILLCCCLLASCGAPSASEGPDTPPETPVSTPGEQQNATQPEPPPTPETVELEDFSLMEGIQLDQLGYRPSDPKIAVVPAETLEFRVVRLTDGASLLKGETGAPIFSAASLETVRLADFSALTEAGEYSVVTPDGKSHPFVISDNPYTELRKATLDFFECQKCGVALDLGVWSHAPCHTTPAAVLDADGKPTGVELDVSGGWHDAGDYGRYIVPAAQTVAQLLMGYEMSPNPDEDVLSVTWFEIEWMLKMQDAETGGVYHKVSCKNFNALDQMPDKETAQLVICPVSATATADFAAAMALASRFYPEQSETLLSAARRAWDWCLANPDAPGFKNPIGVVTGEYGDSSSSDERFWAACELFAATGDETCHEYIKNANTQTGLGWQQMGTFGIAAYLFQAGDKADPDVTERLRSRLIGSARSILDSCETDPYGISLGTNYYWGCNMAVGNNAMTLLLADRLEPDEAYQKAALEHMHYLLGKNALNQSYISGFGEKAMQNPHHRLSVAVKATVPGMVAGGPNADTSQDPKLNATRAGEPPMKCYIDDIESYASNEITIYWNSPVYFVLAALGM